MKSIQELAAIGPVGITSGQVTDTGKTTIAKMVKAAFGARGVYCAHVMVERPWQPSDAEDSRMDATQQELDGLANHLLSVGEDETVIVDIGGHVFPTFAATASASGNMMFDLLNLILVPVNYGSTKADSIEIILNELMNAKGVSSNKLCVVFSNVPMGTTAAEIQAKYESLFFAATKFGFRIVLSYLAEHAFILETRGQADVNMYVLAAEDKTAAKNLAVAANRAGNKDEGVRFTKRMLEIGKAGIVREYAERMFKEIIGE